MSRRPTARVPLSERDLDTLILLLILHGNDRQKALAAVPALSSGELTAIARQQARLGSLRERLERERAHLGDA